MMRLGLRFLATTMLIGCGSGGGSANMDLAGPHMVLVGPNGMMSFSPASLTVSAGDTVQWVWSAGSHTVTSGSGTADGKFCSGSPSNPTAATCAAEGGHGAGFTYSHAFSTAGSFPYYCTIHGLAMSGTIVVQ